MLSQKDTELIPTLEQKKSVAHIWIIDDDLQMLSFLKKYFIEQGYSCSCFESPTLALQKLNLVDQGQDLEPDLVLTDLHMPQIDGLEFTRQFRDHRPHTPIILMTAHASLDTAIEGIRRGAFDYLSKPIQLNELGLSIQRAFHFTRLEKDNEYLREELKNQWKLGKMIGKSKAMKNVFDLIMRVSKASAHVLISGESGTGKELVAQALHQLGPRSQHPFIAINCSAIPDELLESELFGHARGSFTGAYQKKKGLFEEAHGGTLFLDEIGDLNLPLQAKLLRVLQDHKIRAVGDNQYKEIDVRVIAATHKDLKESIRNGTFREDLYYRLSVIPILIPPLKYRKEDIPLLAEHFLAKYASINNSKTKGFTKSAMEKLIHLPWPGNVRELENLVERLMVLSEKDYIEAEDIPTNEESTFETFFSEINHELPPMSEVEKRYIEFVLEKTNGKKEKAAQILGIHRRTLYRKEKEPLI
ncbi:MAG TPA: sigma-54 dependent transcriptional regulator [Pseudobdellovibrionaceae bacterium]|nr:sigma-54 dependent transcriptional regulator [Pseudobdellovibrionaceae bacterium]